MLGLPLPKMPFPLFLLKGAVVLLFLLLLIYSVLIEIPLSVRRHRGSVEKVPAPGERRVVAVGFYGIVRHPGFFWFLFLWIAIDILYLNPLVTLVGAGLVAIDLLLVVLEDLVFFPRIFPGYEEYKKKVPFVIPHLKWR